MARNFLPAMKKRPDRILFPKILVPRGGAVTHSRLYTFMLIFEACKLRSWPGSRNCVNPR